MRNKFAFTLAAGLIFATASWAQTGGTGRSSIIQGGITADETGRLEIVRGEIQDQLNVFIGNQRTIIRELETVVIPGLTTRVQELCMLLYNTVNVNGAIFHVPVSVPAPGVVLPPGDLDDFCRSVMQIELPGHGNDPDVKPAFRLGTLPPSCNPNSEDLMWTGTRWECVTTLTGRCTQPGTNSPRWVRVTTP